MLLNGITVTVLDSTIPELFCNSTTNVHMIVRSAHNLLESLDF